MTWLRAKTKKSLTEIANAQVNINVSNTIKNKKNNMMVTIYFSGPTDKYIHVFRSTVEGHIYQINQIQEKS